ncbi:unnamed protein product, partial [Owenia fusiformis]
YRNGGTCDLIESSTSYNCTCTGEYHGTTCNDKDVCIMRNPCGIGGTCELIESSTSYNCTCTSEYGGTTYNDKEHKEMKTLSIGAITGIAVGSIIFVGIAAIFIVYISFTSSCRKSSSPSHTEDSSTGPQISTRVTNVNNHVPDINISRSRTPERIRPNRSRATDRADIRGMLRGFDTESNQSHENRLNHSRTRLS